MTDKNANARNSGITADSPTPARGAYHHGELPIVLMDLAVKAIATKGTEALSLRALARDAGVSATAPYRHFPSKRCLFAAIAQLGFEDLTRRMGTNLQEHSTPQDRFIGMGLAYVQFAVENPVAYQLMFGSVLADFSEYELLQKAAESCYDQLIGELTLLIEAEQLDILPLELGAVVWSGVHGMAALMINGMGAPEDSVEQRAKSLPGQSIGILHANTERAMRIMFGNLVGDTAAIHGSNRNG